MAIREVHSRHGHIQEVIVQSFRAKKDTAMALQPEPDHEELLWTISCARIILGPGMNIQAPPNLTSVDSGQEDQGAGWRGLIDAGINDWGGLSPVTRDFVNPEKP